MKLRRLGNSGLRVSEVALGTVSFGIKMSDDMVAETIKIAFDRGVNFIDTSDNYGRRGRAEELLGAHLGARRKDVVLATKWGSPMDDAGHLSGNSRRYIMMAVEASLRRLRTDWIDLYQVHRPDPLTPLEETIRALDDLVRQGKVRYVGHSNFAGWQVADAAWLSQRVGSSPFIASQSEYSLISREIEVEVIPSLRAHGVGLLAILPLAAGMLVGRYRRGQTIPADARVNQSTKAKRYRTEAMWPYLAKLEEFCASRSRTMLELAMNWLLAQQDVSSVIVGVSSPQQFTQNLNAVGWSLTPEEMEVIDQFGSDFHLSRA